MQIGGVIILLDDQPPAIFSFSGTALYLSQASCRRRLPYLAVKLNIWPLRKLLRSKYSYLPYLGN